MPTQKPSLLNPAYRHDGPTATELRRKVLAQLSQTNGKHHGALAAKEVKR